MYICIIFFCRKFCCRSRGGLSANEKEENFAPNDNNTYERVLYQKLLHVQHHKTPKVMQITASS